MFSPPSRNFSREKGRDGWLQSFPDQSSQSILRKNTKINTNYYAMHIPETDTRHLFSIFTTIRHKKSRTWTSPYAFVCCLVLVLGFASRWPHTPIHNRRGREKTKLRFARPRSWPRYYVTVSSQLSQQPVNRQSYEYRQDLGCLRRVCYCRHYALSYFKLINY